MSPMLNIPSNSKILLICAVFAVFSCDSDNERPSLRTKLDYSVATPATPYSELFIDATGATTVDLFEGNTRLRMFQALNSYSSTAISSNSAIPVSYTHLRAHETPEHL